MNKRLAGAMLVSTLLPTPAGQAQQKGAGTKPEAGRPELAPGNQAAGFLSGEINVSVRGDENPIIRLPMMAGGQTLVEFPARDRIFRVNPADPDLVTIEDSPTKETDRFILLRSGRQFLPAPAGPAPNTSVIVQMTPGMVITLLIIPARDTERVVHRCVVRYEREAIIRARQTAGLAVNLDLPGEGAEPRAVASSIQMAPAQAPRAAAGPQAGDNPLARPVPAAVVPPITISRELPADRLLPDRFPFELLDTQDLNQLRWTKPLHGLKASAQSISLRDGRRMVLLTLVNTLAVPLRLAPGSPELSIRTLDDRGRVLQVEPLRPLKTEASNNDGIIAAGQVARYLISYAAPVLGVRQKLCVSAAQISAADAPVMIEPTSGLR
ncbi:MAG: hypothetical protein ACKV2V_25295 [Blastocatellia bacterium]